MPTQNEPGRIGRGRSIWNAAAPALVLLVLILITWEGASRLFHIPTWMLPAPHEVLQRITEDWKTWLTDTGQTLLESVLGFLAGAGFGVVAGILFAHSRPLERALYPYAIAIKTIPLVALAPILAIWFPSGITSKVMMGAVITFFPCIVNTVQGLRTASPETLDLMASLAATRSQIFWMLRLPAALPSIFSAFKISSTLAVIGAIVAEMVGARAGLGLRIAEAQERTDMATMIAGVVLASIVGIIFFQAVNLVERRLVYWTKPE